ncbi:MAG: hypothetical protein AB7L65_09910 [Hyphomonadaceae bacterium]
MSAHTCLVLLEGDPLRALDLELLTKAALGQDIRILHATSAAEAFALADLEHARLVLWDRVLAREGDIAAARSAQLQIVWISDDPAPAEEAAWLQRPIRLADLLALRAFLEPPPP